MELMNQLGIEVSQKYDIPVEHINIVKERMADSDLEPNRIEDWEVAKKKLNFDSWTLWFVLSLKHYKIFS